MIVLIKCVYVVYTCSNTAYHDMSKLNAILDCASSQSKQQKQYNTSAARQCGDATATRMSRDITWCQQQFRFRDPHCDHHNGTTTLWPPHGDHHNVTTTLWPPQCDKLAQCDLHNVTECHKVIVTLGTPQSDTISRINTSTPGISNQSKRFRTCGWLGET